jgi:hypothetical protein
MDLKALIAKMDQIESKKILTEAEDRPDAKKKETTWTDKDGKKHPATQVQGHQSVKADKEADKEKKKDMDESIVLQSAIAKALAEEFGYDLDERVTPDGKGGYTGGLRPQPAAAPAANAPANPWANDPEKAKAWGALSPEDQKWLGGADPTDQFILARAPNKGKPAAPASLAPASPMANKTRMPAAAPDAAAGAATKPTDTSGAPGAQDDVTGVDAAVAAQQDAAGPTDAEIAANNAALGNFDADVAGGSAGEEAPELAMGAGQPAAGGINPTTLNRYKELLDKLEATGKAPAPAKPTQVAPAPKKPATGAGTKPANSLPGTAVPGGGNIADNPAAESVDRLADDQILAIIRNI